MTNATLKEWAMKNGLDSNIKSMTQAEKTMLRYQYVMANTSAVQGDFAKTSLTWANQVRILGQNFQRLGAVIGSGFIAWLRPMIVQVNAAMDSIIAAVQKTVNALGKIFGWQMIVDTTGNQLIDDTEGVADAWDDATGAAKKYAKQLLGIDELNNLTTQDKSGSGADSGIGGGLSGGNIIDPGGIKFEKFQSDIVGLFQLGDKISDKLREMLDGINWESIYEKARNFGKGFASFLNGLIQPDTFREVGKTIAGALNIAVESVLAFAKQGRWEQWGESIGESINGFFREFKWDDAGQAINQFVHGLWDALKKGVETIDWKNVFSSLWTFFENVGIDTIGLIIGAITIKKVGKWVFGGGLTSALGTALSTAIKNSPTFAKTVFGGISTALSSMGGVGGLLTEDLGLIFGAGTAAEIGLTIGTAVIGGILAAWSGWNLGQILYEKISGETIDMSFGEQMSEIFSSFTDGSALDALKLWGEDIAGAFSEIENAIKKPFNGIGSWLDTNVFSPISMMASDLWTSITSVWNNAKTWFNTNVTTPISTLFSGITTRVSQLFQGAWIIVKGTWQIVSEWFNTNVIQPVCTFFGNVTTSIGQFFSDLWNKKIVPLWKTVSGWFNVNVITPVRTFFSNLTTSISTFFSNAWTKIKSVWNGVSNWFNVTILIPLKTNFQTVVTSIGGFFSGLWSDIQNGAKFAANGIIGFFEKAVNGIIDNINGFLDMFNKAGKFAANITGDSWSGVDLIPHISIPGFEYGGFPNQGSVFVAGETYGQSEWVGNINGKTGVVSGYEITDISKTIRETSEQEMMMMRQEISLLQGILAKEFGISQSTLGQAVQSYGQEWFDRTGRQAFQY